MKYKILFTWHIIPRDIHTFLPIFQRKQVWVSCNGEYSSDEESLKGMKYFPSRGFPGYFYPFKNAPGYLSPLIAVQIERPARKYTE